MGQKFRTGHEKFIIDIDESVYTFVNQNLNSASRDFTSIKGCKILVTDFSNTCVSGGMNVSANIKYAEAMVVKRLQDDGDFDEPVSVITHWKKKTGKTSTEIFFTAVPTRIYLQYLDKINEHEDLLILLPIFSVLADFTKQILHKDPMAVVFRHGSFADIVIADKTRLYYITRCVAFDTSREQIIALWKTIEQEIKNACEENSVKIDKIISLNWIDTIDDEPFCSNFEKDCFVFNEEPVFGDDDMVYNISFTKALKMSSPLRGIAPHNGKLFYYADKLYPFIMVIFAILIFALSSGYFLYHSKTEKLKHDIVSIKRNTRHIRDVAVSSMPPVKMDYSSALKFIDSIFYAKYFPSYRKIINDISSGMYSSTKINDLTMEYKDKSVQVSLTGIIDADFDTAYFHYAALVSNLINDGYSIHKKKFNTDIQKSGFKLVFSWTFNKNEKK